MRRLGRKCCHSSQLFKQEMDGEDFYPVFIVEYLTFSFLFTCSFGLDDSFHSLTHEPKNISYLHYSAFHISARCSFFVFLSWCPLILDSRVGEEGVAEESIYLEGSNTGVGSQPQSRIPLLPQQQNSVDFIHLLSIFLSTLCNEFTSYECCCWCWLTD